jgi:hypothetical protein
MSITTEYKAAAGEPQSVKKNHGYVFVLTPIDLLGSQGAEIAPDHRIVKANENQVVEIRDAFQKFNTNPMFISPYEIDITSVQGSQPGHIQHLPKQLSPEEWRYWIIEFDGTNIELQNLHYACALIANDFELGFHFAFHDGAGKSFGWDPAALHTFTQHHRPLPAKKILQQDLLEIRRNFDDIKNLPAEYIHIGRALRRFDQLRWLPRLSEMVIIGLFSVIESLVSHAPKLTDSADSLSHQLRTKLPLVRKRFHPNLDFSNYFSGIQEDTLWTKLYAYRSRIVHGEDCPFTGDLQCLKDIKSVIAYLRETSKSLLILSLREPQLMTDLKKC